MFKRIILTLIFLFITAVLCFGQAGTLREYVGLVSINYHSDVIDLINKIKDSLEEKGYSRDAKVIEAYLQGAAGSGFVYVAPNGVNYILTNEHVVNNADSFSITFEKQDGTKTIHDQLKILCVDEEKDIAILYFESGTRPFTRGLSFNTQAINEGTAVFAAGFPALGTATAWQFTQGIVSNASVRIQKDIESDELMGPFIQHTAQIDPGNSGGPLLVARQGVPANYAVAGINTLSVRWRQAANFAIPIDQVNTFITAALAGPPANQQEIFEKKVDDFIKGLSVNRAVYDHIAGFLSNNCIAINAEYAILELLDKASRTVIRDIDAQFSRNPAEGMRLAVAWYIENTMRPRSGVIKIELDSISPNDKGGFTAAFNVNGTVVQTEWINEYGVFRMDTYGNITTGDKSLVREKVKRTKQEKALRTGWDFMLNAGFSHILEDIGPAITASVLIDNPFYYGIEVTYAFGDIEYTNICVNFGYMQPIRLTSIAILPFGGIGMGIIINNDPRSSFDFQFDMNFNIKGGLMFTTAAVPGLVLRTFYSHNITLVDPFIPNHGLIGITVGYGF